jgi:flagellar FliJ protein
VRRFQFRLDPVLRVRTHELERRRTELRAAEARAREAAEELRTARARAEARASELGARSREGLRAGELELAQRGARRLYQQVRAGERALAAAEARGPRARGQVREAHGRVRALELLRERALAAWVREGQRREQAELDEVGARMGGAGGGSR